MTTTYSKPTVKDITTNIYHMLHKFFGGQFHFGIHGITYSQKQNKMTEWCHPVAWFKNEDLQRNANLSDIEFCIEKSRRNLDIYVRPAFDVEDEYILFDDVSAEKAVKWSKRPGTLVVSTSAGKFQVWRHLDRKMSYDEKMAHIKAEQADTQATATHRWYRCPGFRNFKEKYTPNFPIARLISITEGLATLPVIDIVKTEEARIYPVIKTKTINITREKYNKGNESDTDFSYILALLCLSASDEEIMSRIMNERKVWDNKPVHQELRENYVKRSIENAKRCRMRSPAF